MYSRCFLILCWEGQHNPPCLAHHWTEVYLVHSKHLNNIEGSSASLICSSLASMLLSCLSYSSICGITPSNGGGAGSSDAASSPFWASVFPSLTETALMSILVANFIARWGSKDVHSSCICCVIHQACLVYAVQWYIGDDGHWWGYVLGALSFTIYGSFKGACQPSRIDKEQYKHWLFYLNKNLRVCQKANSEPIIFIPISILLEDMCESHCWHWKG